MLPCRSNFVEKVYFENQPPITRTEFIAGIGETSSLIEPIEAERLAKLLIGFSNTENLLESSLNAFKGMLLAQDTNILYDTQSIILIKEPKYFVRANIWPNLDTHTKASTRQYNNTYSYKVPHNHGFSFLTACHYGPGYTTDVCEMTLSRESYDRLKIGEEFPRSKIQEHQLKKGTALQFDSIYDIHVQHPPEDMTITLNLVFHEDILHIPQYVVDLERSVTVSRPNGSAYTRQRILGDIAMGLGNPFSKQINEILEQNCTPVHLRTVLEEARDASLILSKE